MRKKTTSIESIVAGAARSSQRVHVRVGNGAPIAEVWLEGPTLTAAWAEGGDHRLGARLVSMGHLAPAELERARLEARRASVSLSLALAERIRHDVLAGLARDEARYAMAAALAAPPEEVAADVDAEPSGLTPIALDAVAFLDETREFLDEVRRAQQVAPADAIPMQDEPPPADLALAPEQWAILSRADGSAPISQLADECGFPQPEASLIVTRLVGMGLISIQPGLAGSEALLAELDAAQDLAAVTAAFAHADAEAAVLDAPDIDAAATLVLPPLEPLPEPHTPEPHTPEQPAVHAVPDQRVDTASLLRELASLARDPQTG